MSVSNELRRPAVAGQGFAWQTSPGLVPYPEAVDRMEARVAGILAGRAEELVWLLEHPPLYTAGTSTDPAELLAPDALPVYPSGRGGRYTYHGPGQRIAYVMADLHQRGRDVRAYVQGLEEWIIRALGELGVRGERRAGRIGIWVAGPGAGGEAKIAAVGVRIRRWVTFHGIAINVNPDLGKFAGIVPCGVREHGVTSLAALGGASTMQDLDAALRRAFDATVGAQT